MATTTANSAKFSINSPLFTQVVSLHHEKSSIPLQALLYAWAVSLINNNNSSVLNTASESDAYATYSTSLNELLSTVQTLQFVQSPSLTATDPVSGYNMELYQAVTSSGFNGGTIDGDTDQPVMTLGELQALTETIKTKIDTLSNTTQKTQLRLQQVIGTLNTGTETTSNMMSKIFTGLERITSNIGR